MRDVSAEVSYDVDVESLRKRDRRECRDAPRPCTQASCKYNLYLDPNEDTGTITYNFPETDITEMRPNKSCALDLADEHEGVGMTLEEVGDAFGLTRERIRQIEGAALKKLKEAAEAGHIHTIDFEALARVAAAGHTLSGIQPPEE